MQMNESDAGSAIIDDDDENFSVDMGTVQDAKFEVIPKGDYDVTISALTYGRSQSSNKPMWTVQLEIDSGDFIGRKIFTILSFSEKALPLTKASISAFAPDLAQTNFKPKEVADTGILLGKKARVRTKIEPYNGDPQTRVAKWMPPAEQGNAFLSQ